MIFGMLCIKIAFWFHAAIAESQGADKQRSCITTLPELCQLQFDVFKPLIAPKGQTILLRELNRDSDDDIRKAHFLISNNFKSRAEYSEMNSDVIELYLQANSPDNLKESLTKPDTVCFVLIDLQGEFKGIVVARYNQESDGLKNLQIRRLHTSLSSYPEYKGIGKCLLNACAAHAVLHDVFLLTTTASIPARGFFENLGWCGEVIETPYKIGCQENSKIVFLPQYRCQFLITPLFKGF